MRAARLTGFALALAVLPLSAARAQFTAPFEPNSAQAQHGEAVAQLFIEACLNGQLRLGKDRGEIVTRDKLPELVRGLLPGQWGSVSETPTSSLTIVKLNDPPSTYIFMATYKVKKPHRGNPAASCTLVSRSISLEQSAAFFVKLAPEARVVQGYYYGQWPADWTREVPEKGYSIFLRTVAPPGMNPPWIKLEATTYPAKPK